MNNKAAAVIVAAGSGKRMGAKGNKVFLPLLGTSVLARTVSVFQKCGVINDIIIVTRECDIELCEKMVAEYRFSKVKNIISGGNTRQKSVYNGLAVLDDDTGIAVIHDGARALVEEKHIVSVVEAARKYGAAAVGVRCKDTLKRVNSDGFIEGTVDRECTYNIQTPQAFDTDLIFGAHIRALNDGFSATDDCAVVEYCGFGIKVIEGSYDNIKLTTPEDLTVAENILKNRRNMQ